MNKKNYSNIIWIRRFALGSLFFSLHFELFNPFGNDTNFIIIKVVIITYFISIIPNLRKYLSIKSWLYAIVPLSIYFIILTVVSYRNVSINSDIFFDFPLFLNIILLILILNHLSYDFVAINWALISFIIGGVTVSILYLLNFEVSFFMGRAMMFKDNQNITAIRLTFTILLMLYYIFIKKDFTGVKIFFFLTWPFVLIFLVATGSRVAVICLFLSMLSFFVLISSKDVIRRIGVLFIGFGLIIILIEYISQNLLIINRLMDSFINGDLSGRNFTWQVVFADFMRNPIIGSGLTGYYDNTALLFGYYTSPHNVIIETLSYTGILGTIFFVLFIYRITKHSVRYLKKDNGILPIVLLIPIYGLILSGQLFHPKVAWLILAIIIYATTENYYIKNAKIEKE